MPSWPAWALLPGDVLTPPEGADAIHVDPVLGVRLVTEEDEDGSTVYRVLVATGLRENPGILKFDRDELVSIWERPESWWQTVPAWSVLVGDEVFGRTGPCRGVGNVYGEKEPKLRLIFEAEAESFDPLAPVLVRRGITIQKREEAS